MGDFAVSVAVAYQIGAARGDYSIFSAMDIRDDELFAEFGRSLNDLILRHRKDLEIKRETRTTELKIEPRWLEATRTAEERQAGDHGHLPFAVPALIAVLLVAFI